MVRNNMTLIRCPCRKCGLRQWIDPDSGQLEEHLLRRGFMLSFNEEPAANVGHEEEADIGREDEESLEHGVHHEEGEADEGDDDAGGDGGGDAESKQTPLTSALRDPHVQELLLKDTGNAKPEAKLAQMEVNHGFKACVKCMDKTPHLQLPKAPGSCKTVFQGTRMWLRFDHPWRKRKDLFNGEEELGRAPRPRSGEEISELLENWEECPTPRKKRPRESPLLGVWKARSVFRDLPYWKVLHTPHSLDVMHIMKNVTESLLGTLMNMPERTKDGPKARTDLKLLGLKKELQYPTDSDDDDDDEQTETTQGHHKRAKKNEVVVLKPACFTLSEEELERFFECLLGKVHGYSGKISRYPDVAKKRFSGMKSHDCHVLMTQILPMRGIMDDHVRETLFGLCNFFDVISRKSIGVKQLNRLQEEIVEILCELEMYFPPAFFDIMVHMLVHVVDDIIHLGPTFLHNMMPFERLNGVIKGFVRNRARSDGSIAMGFLTYECISFCQNYLSTENEDVGLPTRKHVGRLAGFGHREGYRAMHVGIAGRHADFDRAHRVALQHIELVSPWVDKHKSLIEQKFIDLGRPRKQGTLRKSTTPPSRGGSRKGYWKVPHRCLLLKSKLIFSPSRGPGTT
ncbi:hypothetical protein QYE76_025581 [Lolium multiflorum]|uniref:DUF4218 domain-containing protein n=1 Tax=Lolium multiflorum TaxID=4521 RepID=A0AAD8RH31_LOLMU|nr:hypothetical protein QYE76_025581 [Lolium multiflorum]